MRCAPQYAGGGTGSRWPYLSEAPADPGRDRCTLRRNAHDDGVGPPCADSSPTPARTLGEPTARNAARPQHGQPHSTLHDGRPEPRKVRKGEAGIRDLRPFRIPAPPGAPIARHPGSRETDGTANNAPPGHSAEQRNACCEFADQLRHAIEVGSVRRATGQASRWGTGFQRGSVR